MRPSAAAAAASSSREERRRRSPTSPVRDRSKTSSSRLSGSSRLSPSASTTSLFEDLQISQDQDYANSNPNPNPNPRSFPHSVKQQCWEKADKIRGRDPDRWRRDALGNTVFRKLVGCPGCLCHDFDHILPYSKFQERAIENTVSMFQNQGGKSTLENCQVLQATVNRSKGNRTEISKAELIQKSSYCRVSGRDMDLLELSAYGNVRHGPDSGGCRIQ